MAMSSSQCTSEVTESDEVPEMFCEHCENEGKYATATGFCVDCTEFMCDVCMKYHKQYKSKHITQSKDNMPQDYCFEKCSVHSDKCIKFYCEECTDFACSKCVSSKEKSHKRECHSKTWLPLLDLVRSTESKAYTRVTEEAGKTKSDIIRMEHQIHCMRQKWLKCNEQVRESIKQHRRELERTIHDIEQQFLKTVDEKEDTFKLSLDSVSKELTGIKMKTDAAEAYQKEVQHSDNRCLKFIAMKDSERRSRAVQYELNKLQDKLVYTEYDFKGIENRTFDKHDFGSFVPRYSKQKSVTTQMYELDVDVSTWIISASINNICEHSGLLVAVVRYCNTVVLLDPVLQKVLSKFSTSASPARSTSFSRNRIAVTLPGEGKIQLLGISDSGNLEKSSDIKVELGCWGVAYGKDQDCLYVSYVDKNNVTALKETGEVLKVFDKDILGNNLFITPRDIAVALDGRYLYVSDTGRDMVIKMRLDGKVETVYKDENLKYPRGIAVDETGSIYVCSEKSNNIHHLSADLAKIGIAVESKDVQSPISVALCKCGTSKCLSAGFSFKTKIKVFSLS